MLIYIVDDDPLFCKALEMFLRSTYPALDLVSFSNGEACLHELHKRPDLILLDYKLDSEFGYAWDGMQILNRISSLDPGLPVVILSSCENAEVAMDFISNGAVDYVVKNEKTFPHVRDLLEQMKDELLEEEDVPPVKMQQTPQLIGLAILIVFIIILLLKL